MADASNKKTVKINTKKIWLLNLPYFIKYIFGGEIFPLVAFFALGFLLMPFSTLVYLFLNPILLMMVYKLAFDVLADAARGHMSPVVRQNYLVTNAVAIKVAIIAILFEGVLFMMKRHGFDAESRFLFVVLTSFVTPAIYMSLALTNSLVVALNPLTVLKIIRVTHLSYALMVVFWVVLTMFHDVIINPFVFEHLPIFLAGVLSNFSDYIFLILNFHIMGYIVYQNRLAFDLEGMGISTAKDDDIEIMSVEVNPIHERIKMLLADDEAEQALAMIIEIQKAGDHSANVQDLYKKAMEMKFYSPSNLEIGHKVHRRLRDKQIKRAFAIVSKHVDAGQEFTEVSPEDIRQLIEYAVVANKTKYIAVLVKDYHIKYPYHADIVPNYFILAKVLYTNRETRKESEKILVGLVQKYPHDKHMSEVKAWLQGLQLMAKK